MSAPTWRRRLPRTRATSRCAFSNPTSSGIEQAIDHYNAQLPELASFVLPGGSAGAALLHVVRTIVRRAERHTWQAIAEFGSSVEVLPARYLNRLSDLLFVLARYANATTPGIDGDVLVEAGGQPLTVDDRRAPRRDRPAEADARFLLANERTLACLGPDGADDHRRRCWRSAVRPRRRPAPIAVASDRRSAPSPRRRARSASTGPIARFARGRLPHAGLRPRSFPRGRRDCRRAADRGLELTAVLDLRAVVVVIGRPLTIAANADPIAHAELRRPVDPVCRGVRRARNRCLRPTRRLYIETARTPGS